MKALEAIEPLWQEGVQDIMNVPSPVHPGYRLRPKKIGTGFRDFEVDMAATCTSTVEFLEWPAVLLSFSHAHPVVSRAWIKELMQDGFVNVGRTAGDAKLAGVRMYIKNEL